MIKKQILEHPRNRLITFDPTKHEYHFHTGEKFRGVTSWISEFTKPFDREKVAKNVARKEGKTVDQIIKEWDGATDYGTAVHNSVEKLINTGEHDGRPEIEHFLKAMEDYELTPILNEWVVFDETIRRASPIDIICTNKENKLVVVDMKTMAKPISFSSYRDPKMIHPLSHLPDAKYYKQALQVNIYKYWLETKYDMPVADTHYVLHLREAFGKMIPIVDLTHEIKLMYENENRD